MKRLFTVFFVSAFIALFLNSGTAQTRSHSVALHPSSFVFGKGKVPVPIAHPRSLFLTQSKNTPMLSPLVLPDDTTLFYMDTTDPNLISVNLMPGRINIDTSTPPGSADAVPDTLIGFGEHFTSPYAATKTYLYSVQFVIAVTNIADFDGNYLRIRASKSRNNSSGTPFPSTTVDSVDITDLTPILSDDPTNPSFFIETIPMNGKLVGSKDFFITLESALDPTQSILTTDGLQNQILIECDQQDFTTFNTKIQRGYGIGLPDGSPDNFSLVWAGITNMNHPSPYYSNFWIVAEIGDVPLGVDDKPLSGNALAQNYPNPVNGTSDIRYSLANDSRVSLKVYNALGVQVASLADGYEAAGEHHVSVNAENLSSGTYYYTLQTGAFSQTKQLIIAK
jgi:hypothetical protein